MPAEYRPHCLTERIDRGCEAYCTSIRVDKLHLSLKHAYQADSSCPKNSQPINIDIYIALDVLAGILGPPKARNTLTPFFLSYVTVTQHSLLPLIQLWP